MFALLSLLSLLFANFTSDAQSVFCFQFFGLLLLRVVDFFVHLFHLVYYFSVRSIMYVGAHVVYRYSWQFDWKLRSLLLRGEKILTWSNFFTEHFNQFHFLQTSMCAHFYEKYACIPFHGVKSGRERETVRDRWRVYLVGIWFFIGNVKRKADSIPR